MRRPVEAVDAQIQAWRGSAAEALRSLEDCRRAFEHSARTIEEFLASFARPQPPGPPPEAAAGRQWRWQQSGYILFWTLAVLLFTLAFAAGYYAALSG